MSLEVCGEEVDLQHTFLGSISENSIHIDQKLYEDLRKLKIETIVNLKSSLPLIQIEKIKCLILL